MSVQLTHNTQKSLEESLGIKIVSCQQIPHGVDNDVFLCKEKSKRRYIVKIYEKKNIQEVKNLCRLHNLLERNEVDLPKIIKGPLEYQSKPVVVYEYIPGNHCDKLTEKSCDFITQSMAKFHGFTAPPITLPEYNSTKSFFFKILRASRSFPAAHLLEEMLLETYDGNIIQQLPKSLIHGDFSPSNILFIRNKGYILDYDHAGISHRLADIARAQIFFSFNEEGFFMKENCDLFLKNYEKYITLTEIEKTFLYKYIVLELIKIIAQTYYYVDVIQEVPRTLFAQSKYNMSPETLMKRLQSIYRLAH